MTRFFDHWESLTPEEYPESPPLDVRATDEDHTPRAWSVPPVTPAAFQAALSKAQWDAAYHDMDFLAKPAGVTTASTDTVPVIRFLTKQAS